MSRHIRNNSEWLEWEDWEQDHLGVTENAVFPEHINKENYQPRTLVDQTLETVDPIPNIHTLFVQFNAKFFRNVLLPVEVKWSPRMTSCAGVCTFRSRNRQCVISLSAPLLKLRPRKDLVETLLHEMIHAYLFLTNNNRDRDGHGPEFCKHMRRINAEAGTNITIYHNFHDEVKLYQQHWWKCNGPCKNRAPYFGTVRRAMNRPPGPSDCWYEAHRRTCGGTFVKIREPDKPNSKNSGGRKPRKKSEPNQTLDTWLSPPREQKPVPQGLVKLGTSANNVHGFGTGGPGSSQVKKNDNFGSSGSIKLGTSANNVRGWGTGGPAGSTSKGSPQTPSQPRYKISGVLGGGSNSGRSCLLDKFSTPPKTKGPVMDLTTPVAKKPRIESSNLQECPVCHIKFPEASINTHLDECLEKGNADAGAGPCDAGGQDLIECPLCFDNIPVDGLQDHVNRCIFGGNSRAEDKPKTPSRKNKSQNPEVRTTPPDTGAHDCLICGTRITPDMSLLEHLDICVKIRYGDDTDDDISPVKNRKSKPTEYPCPVCMEMYSAEVMDDHLNVCI
ncbi:sprT-like domain-containing protein Spartan [Fopius arisanus]|uniref:Protein with SprT-like domain at the N terminus n=1 Tax=Fopius arisanus TaxID=64838 RepID=A0A9R1TCZ1_9HYME|nr:PREDICTED: sprT-like domain-containing protein Spartan [Fopius arisanus]XP_011307085.1 PREDICTED: sprT-like domain-containing protein Spartan [Fopius arisanus]